MGHISFVGKLDGVALSAGAPAITPGFTLDLMARHSLDFWLTSEDLPHTDSRVTLDRDGNIVLSYMPNNLEAHTRLRAKLETLMQQQTKCDIHGNQCHQACLREVFLLASGSAGGRGAPVRHHTLRARSSHLGAGRQLQSARSG